MERKLSLALLLDQNQGNRLLDMLTPLCADFEIKAMGHLHKLGSDSYYTDIPLQTFIEDPHLPGYLRGVEDELSKADIAIASGVLEAASYQAFRYCHHHAKPFLLFCQREEELKAAITLNSEDFQDCLKQASGFLTYEPEVAETLEFLGVEPERILLLELEIQDKKFGHHSKLRDKFRRYLKLADDALLLVAELSEDTAPLEIMSGLKMLEGLDPELFARVRLLFVGKSVTKEAVKYQAVDLGLSKSVLFVSQDIRPFFVDLMSSADLLIALCHGKDRTERSLSLLEAMACGARPLVNEQHELSGRLPAEWVVRDLHQLAMNLRTLLRSPHRPQAVVAALTQVLDEERNPQKLKDFFRSSFQAKPSQLPLIGDFQQSFDKLKRLGEADFETFLDLFDGELDLWGSNGHFKSRMYLLKGQIYLRNNFFEDAMCCFEMCTAEESVQREAYLGLAKLAFVTQSHDDALSFYRKALSFKPNDPDAMAGIGTVYRKMGMPDEAVYWLGKCLSVELDNTRCLLALTQACAEAEDYEKSIILLEQLKVLLGNKSMLVMCLGQLYFKAGEIEKGKALVDLALAITDGSQALLPAAS